MLLLYAIPVGLIAGLAVGGRLAPLGEVRIRWWPLALGGLLFQLLLFSPPVTPAIGEWGAPLYVGSTIVVLAALLANLGQPGFRLILAGALLNLLVIMANGGQMPASEAAVRAVHGTPDETRFSNSVVMDESVPFYFLGDIFVLPRPIPLANVFSIGDVLIAAGGAWFIALTMRRRSEHDHTPRAVRALPPVAGANRA
jgi:hypothetical protein